MLKTVALGETIESLSEVLTVSTISEDMVILRGPNRARVIALPADKIKLLTPGDTVLVQNILTLVNWSEVMYVPPRTEEDRPNVEKKATTTTKKKAAKKKAKKKAAVATPKEWSDDDVKCIRKTLKGLPNLTTLLRSVHSYGEEGVMRVAMALSMGQDEFQTATRKEAAHGLRKCGAGVKLGDLVAESGPAGYRMLKATDLLNRVFPK